VVAVVGGVSRGNKAADELFQGRFPVERFVDAVFCLKSLGWQLLTDWNGRFVWLTCMVAIRNMGVLFKSYGWE
jgi:hypothetical protein